MSHRLPARAIIVLALMIAGSALSCTSPEPGFAPPPTGTLVVLAPNVPPGAVAKFDLRSPFGVQHLTAPDTVVGLAAGTYTLTALSTENDTAGFAVAFPTQTISVVGGGVWTVILIYLESTGQLAVDIEGLAPPLAGAIDVTGPSNYSQHVTQPVTLRKLQPGPYRVVAAAVGGTARFVPDTATRDVLVDAGVPRAVTVRFHAVTSLLVVIDGLPTGIAASTDVIGATVSQHLSGTATLPDLPAGTYTIRPASVVVNGDTLTAPTDSITLGAAAAETTFVHYKSAAAGAPAPPTQPAPAALHPFISSITPQTLLYEGLDTVLTIDGGGFAPNAVASWRGFAVPTVFVSSTRLQMILGASFLETQVSALVRVTNPTTGDMTDTVRVGFAFPMPVLSAVSPDTVDVINTRVTLTGSGFSGFSAVIVRQGATNNRTGVGPAIITKTSMTTSLPIGVLGGHTGEYSLTVTNPAPGGGVSGTIKVFAINPLPTVTGALADTVTIGVDSIVVLTGSNFVGATSATWNGQLRAAHLFPSGTSQSLVVPLSLADTVSRGVATFGAATPGPGGGTATGTVKIVVR